MSLRFQADACPDADIVRGVRRRAPAIDFRHAAIVIPDGTPDPEVLRVAADAGRVLVTSDAKTMLAHLRIFSPGETLPE